MNLAKTSDPYAYSNSPLNDPHSIDTAVGNIYALFGKNTTVIPIKDENNASQPSWAITTFEQSNTPMHQAELRKSSLAVQCGKESGNLYAIQFDRQADYEAFVQSNPKLQKSLAIGSAVGVIVFLRMPDPMPPSFRFGACAWLAEGQGIPVYSRQNPGAIKGLSRRPPVEVRSSEVTWNDDLMLGFKAYLAEGMYGAPFSKDKKGKWIVNPMFWAEWFRVTTSVSYHPSARQFLWRNKDGSLKPLSDIAVSQALLDFIVKWRGNCPADSVSEGSIKKCLAALKMLAADANEPPTGADQVECFLAESVEVCRGSDVTSEELHEHYRGWCRTSNVIPLAMRQFCVILSVYMAKLYGVGKSHCIGRDGSERRGYSGVQIKGAAIEKDGSDG